MKIGIDIDEVVVDFIKIYLDVVNNNLNSNYSFEDVKTYNLWENFDISYEKAVDFFDILFDSKEFENIDFVENAKNSLVDIKKNHELLFITARPIKVKSKTLNFFNNHFPDNNFNFIFSEEDFRNFKKSEICLKENINLMIEDNSKYALDCAEKSIKVILLDKPWNQGVEHKNIIRVNSWKEILEVLNEI